MTDDFTEMIGRELRSRYDRYIDDYIKEVVIGEETGEPRGILNASPDTVLKRMQITPATYRVDEAL